ncbi:MAG TPA: class I adenylate-forming enzyme family protein [Gaiellaceae bacterium]
MFATLPEALAHWAETSPGARALSQREEELSYAELAELVDDLAARVHVRPGDRVALLAGNRIEWLLALYACLRAGAIAVPLNTRLGRLELERQLAVCEPRVVLADEERLGLVPEAVPIERIWKQPRRNVGVPPPPEAPAVISFTSGTTGAPKGATITHGALARAAASYVEVMATEPGETTTVLVPLFHNTGFVDGAAHLLLVGGAVDLVEEFSRLAALDALACRPAGFLIAVPSIVRLLTLHERADDAFARCRVLAYGGSSTPPAWRGELAARWPHLRLFDVYGLTEFTSISHVVGPADEPRPGSIGRPVPGVAQRLVDGELWLAGPTRMVGYWRAEAEAVLRGEWLRTGDLGEILPDGSVTLQGRAADVINRGGEKIHPAQVEAALADLPAVAEAAVVGAPHPVLGERVVACVTVRNGAELDEAAVRLHLRDRVADYAIPEQLLVVDELPRNGAGKVDRALVRELAP